MKYAALIALIYALFIIIGGTFAYTRAHSIASLAISLAAAAVIVAGSIMTYQGHVAGIFTMLGIIAALCVLFVIRFAMTGKIWPPGILAIISLAALLLIVAIWIFQKPQA